MKLIFFKKFCDVISIWDNNLSITERLYYLGKSIATFTPIVWILNIFNLWFTDNKVFFNAMILFIFINMFLGAVMNFRKNTFDWLTLIFKTMTMVVVIFITYLVLELVLVVAGSNIVTEGFRSALQVATLLYPGSKILKNIFILSNGEYPPEWVMKKIYNFQKNGDLSELLKKKEEEPTEEHDINR